MLKARIRKTGEIINIITFSCSTSRTKYDTVSYIDSKGVEHEGEHLNYYWDLEKIPNLDAAIDWEQRRYEIAKDLFISSYRLADSSYKSALDINHAVELADALIEHLKRSKL